MAVLDADVAVQIFTAHAVAISIRLMLSTGALILCFRQLCRKENIRRLPPTIFCIIVYDHALYVCDFRSRCVKAISLENPG
jgi:hypothetical protein